MQKLTAFLLLAIYFLNKPLLAQNQSSHDIFFLSNAYEIANPAVWQDTLQHLLSQQKEGQSSLLFLGNQTRNGKTETLEQQLQSRWQFLQKYPGNLIFLAGHRDWQKGQRNGYRQILAQNQLLKKHFPDTTVFLPEGGCPGPLELVINPELVLILLDTPWWFHQWERPETDSDCDTKHEADFILHIQDALSRHPEKRVVVAAYHRLDIGTLANPRQKQLKQILEESFKAHPQVIYLSGQSQAASAEKMPHYYHIATGAAARTGFSQLHFSSEGKVELIWRNRQGQVYRRELIWEDKADLSEENISEAPNYQGQTKKIAIGNYDAGWLTRWAMGNNYRREWETESTFPVFDLGKEKGGLEVIKKGGGQATNSLRLEAKDGRQYVLRSVDKQGDRALAPIFRGTIAAKIIQDQTSAAYPYAALTVPVLAEAAGVHHTNPRYVYLPEDPRLGKFQYTFGGAVYLFEERADDDFWQDADFFGNPKDIKSTAKIIEKTREDNDKLIDQQSVLRHRLFDMWIGDWDRHDDQWRWGEFEDKARDIKYYRPIPRDRDQVFFNSDGWVMDLGTHKWGFPKFQGFKRKFRDVAGFNFNGRYFDRHFLTEPSLSDWLQTAQNLQQALSDSVISEALAQIPPEVAQYSAEEIRQKLLQRRQDLLKFARQYYLALAQKVNILGSDKHEEFSIERLNDEETRVRVYKVKKDSRKRKNLIYERTFKTQETKEIRFYGFGGEDHFIVKGRAKKGIKLRLIGGEHADYFEDSSQVDRGAKKTLIYDLKQDTKLVTSQETSRRLSRYESVNHYDRKAYRYPYLGPTLFLGYNVDDGIFLGTGVVIKRPGFRKNPFAAVHTIKANFAFSSNSYNFIYNGEFNQLLGKIDFLLEADIRAPNYVQNFFGLGNETFNFARERGLTYNRVRYHQIVFKPEFRYRWNNERQQLRWGLNLQRVEIEENEERFISNFAINDLDPSLIETERFFTSLNLTYEFDGRDQSLIPQRGIRLQASTQFVEDIIAEDIADISYIGIAGNFSTYWSFGSRFTLALRLGGAHNIGDFEFYQANTLGANENLRGYRNFRFAGRSSLYQNTELRLRLFQLRSFLFNGSFGIYGLNDFGRVWIDEEVSDKWHHGYGVGLWLAPADALLISTSYALSEDDKLFMLRFGFLF